MAPLKRGVLKRCEVRICELSPVTIPANATPPSAHQIGRVSAVRQECHEADDCRTDCQPRRTSARRSPPHDDVMTAAADENGETLDAEEPTEHDDSARG